MFRQKMAEVTNCSCRLIPNQSNDYMLFKTQNSQTKQTIKQPKQKFSLKNQTSSSNKHQNKVTSAQKISFKTVKTCQEQKISISANLDAKKHKIDKTLICSPENSQIRNIEQNIAFGTNISSNLSQFQNIPNGIKTAENNRLKQQNKNLLNSHNQIHFQHNEGKDIFANNYNSQKSGNYPSSYSKINELPKKSLNFQEYYKYVSNPYSVSDKNKQNIHMGDNSQISKYKIDLKMKKQMRKLRNQTLPLQQFHPIPQTQIFHQSLQKFENVSQKTNRATFYGSLTTKNSLNSQNDSMKNSKNQQTSLLNSKITTLNENQSYHYQRIFDQGNRIQSNQSAVFTNRDFNINTHRVTKKDVKSQLLSQVSVSENDYLETRRSQAQKPFFIAQSSHIRQFTNQSPYFQELPIKQENVSIFDMFSKNQNNKQKISIQRVNTINDIMNKSGQCESVLGQGEQSINQNEHSVVIMRYQDLLEATNQTESVTDSNFILRPQHLQIGQKQTQKPHNNFMLDSTKIATNVKIQGRQQFNGICDSTMSVNPNLKKTVKVTKEYLTHNFNMLQ